MWLRYWLKIIGTSIVLSVLLLAVLGAVGVVLHHLPEPVQPWVVGGGLFLAVVAGVSALLHIYQRTH